MNKTIRNLIDKYGADKLHQMINDIVAQQQDYNKLQQIFATHELAKDWFIKFSKDNNLTHKQIYPQTKQDKHGKSCLALNGWRSSGPYVYLWLNRDDRPHIEMGSSIYDIWSGMGYKDTIAKIKKIIRLRSE